MKVKISIIIPSYNQGRYLEECLNSLISQQYDEIEIIVIDGGSTDGSVDIIRKHQEHLAYWVSEPDNGQAHAINKGMAKATGDIVNWLNSDDMLEPGTLQAIAKAWESFYDEPQNSGKYPLICGNARFIYEGEPEKEYTEELRGISLENMISYWKEACEWEQPAMFFPLKLFREVGGCDATQEIAMDYDLWCRLLQDSEVVYTQSPCAIIRRHPDAKTRKWDYKCWLVNEKVSKRYWPVLKEEIDVSAFHWAQAQHCKGWVKKLIRRKQIPAALSMATESLKHSFLRITVRT